MIVSYQHNFIFIKTRKTAGTSIEYGLGPLCGHNDIVAPIGPREDIDRAKTTGVVPRNFVRDVRLEKRYLRSVLKGRRKLLRAFWDELRVDGFDSANDLICTSHATAAQIKLWTNDFWDGAFRFASERHPYEKAVSYAHFRKNSDGKTASDHLDDTIRYHSLGYTGYPQYMIGGKVVVDDFVRHDSLQEDMVRICSRLAVAIPDLPRRRSGTRTDRRDATEILTRQQKDFIYEACAPEFEIFCWSR
jgi:hypothetical protein